MSKTLPVINLMLATEFSQLRTKAGLTIQQAASALGYTGRQIYRFENGTSVPRFPLLRYLRTMISNNVNEGTNRGFTFIDLFAGIGGLRLAFEAWGGECVYTSEWNKFAIQTYVANFPDEHPIVGDITQVNEQDIPDHDVLVAGFPCQPFSLAGVSKKNALGQQHGFEAETQGTLFFDIVRILWAKRPKAFLLENVKNLESHDNGRTIRIILDSLQKQLGYHVEYKILDAQHFLPQQRKRIVIVGFREKVAFSWNDLILPEKNQQKLHTILHTEDGFEEPELAYTGGPNGIVLSKYTLTDHLWSYLQEYAKKHKAKGNGFGYGLVTKNDVARTLSARYHKDGAEILLSNGDGKNPRRLTPRECARLMGYNNDFVIPVSDTQAYKQFGNSVAVPLFKEVVRVMQPHIFSLLDRRLAYQSPLPMLQGV